MKGKVHTHLGRSADGKTWSVMTFVNQLGSKEEAEELMPVIEALVREKIRHGLHAVTSPNDPPQRLQ